MSSNASSLHSKLSAPTSFFGVELWILLLICTALFLLFILCLCKTYRTLKSDEINHHPIACNDFRRNFSASSSALDRRLLPRSGSDIGIQMSATGEWENPQVVVPFEWCRGTTGTISRRVMAFPGAKCGDCYALGEISAATNGFADENVMGNGGGCGAVYRGVLTDNTAVAVRKFLSCEAEDLRVETKAIEHARHRNLVKLLGYCVGGDQRLLVYEYVSNGNLHQWLHRNTAHVSPLTWDARMNIIIGIAKGLAYLHEDIEPKILHKNLRSSNILLDHQWNPKITDFGLSKLFGNESSHSITRTATASGYVAPEYASTGVLTVKSDVYSFGVLVMEIISGRTPIDYGQSQVYLIDRLKSMVARQEFDLVDPKLREIPSLKELKRIILIGLRCTDLEAESRPVMGDVIHMLEPRDLLLSGEQEIRRTASYHNYQQQT